MANKNSVMGKPIQIGNVTLKNRFMIPAVSMEYCVHGEVTDRMVAYLEARAKGGFGGIIVEAAMIDENVRFSQLAGYLWDDSGIEGYRRLADTIHKYGCKAFLQVNHNGAELGVAPGEEWKSVAPSKIPCPLMDVVPHELTVEEIHDQVEKFSDAALRAKKAGFDGIELHGAHGYLIAEFMSQYFNKRFDEYGGSLDNRMRFPLEIIQQVKEKCGEDFPIIFRISVEEFVKGGRTTAETKVIAKMLEDAGVACIDISSSTYGSIVTYEPPMNLPYATLAEYSAEIKKVVHIPVAVVGHVVDPRFAESMVLSEQADIVMMGRAAIADPEIPNKFFADDCKDIRYCLSCNQGCTAAALGGFPAACMTNPHAGFEYLNETAKKEVSKKVIVVGGGPAGILAAEGAAKVGHKVTLIEKEDRLGGAFKYAPIPLDKTQMASLLSWHIAEIKKCGVEILLNKEFTESDYEAMNPDAVILATGTNPSKPPIKGIDGDNVVQATDVLAGRKRVKKSVIIAGGGLVGCETALFLTEQHCQVTIVEMKSDIATDEEFTRRILMMKDLKERNIKVLTDAAISEMNESGVVVNHNGTMEQIQGESIVLALGVKSETTLADQLKEKENVIVVGDGVAPVNALIATRKGFEAGIRV
jgi:2,4-dienoyl-CoA reductase-like NADH-dependent reductase (Old Yellow Enzyme family)/thioredoxin reductase